MKKYQTQPTVPQGGFTPPRSLAGFTLVETLVAITILLLVVIGPMTVAQKGIQTAYHANNEVTAVFLAQEALEGVRQLRDQDALSAFHSTSPSDDTWEWYGASDELHTNCKNSTGCAYDASSNSFGTCSSNNECQLKFDATSGRYHYNTGIDSPFTRKVYIGPVTNGGVSVKVDVTWDPNISNMPTKTVSLQSWVYDHYQRFEN